MNNSDTDESRCLGVFTCSLSFLHQPEARELFAGLVPIRADQDAWSGNIRFVCRSAFMEPFEPVPEGAMIPEWTAKMQRKVTDAGAIVSIQWERTGRAERVFPLQTEPVIQ